MLMIDDERNSDWIQILHRRRTGEKDAKQPEESGEPLKKSFDEEVMDILTQQ